MTKALERLEIQEKCFNIIKEDYNKPKANINLNRENLKAILLKSGRGQELYLLNIVLEALARAIKQLKEMKAI